MNDFVNYQIKEILKRDNQYHYKEKDLDIEFVKYCIRYIENYGRLKVELYNHLNNIYWKYKED